MSELLLGSGNNITKRITFKEIPPDWSDDLVTLDIDPRCHPQVVHDLRNPVLPFPDNRFDEIHAYEVLEHTGQQGDWKLFFEQFNEFWRVLKPGGWFIATCPMWDSPWSWSDPGHSRIISKHTLTFLSQKEYEIQIGKTAMTDYRAWYKGDFELFAAQESEHQVGFVLRAIK